MSDTFEIKRGDRSPVIRYSLLPASVSLAGATVRFNMRARGGSAPVVNRATATIVTQTPPVVEYAWQVGDTAAAGLFEAEFEVTYSDGKAETFPNNGFIPVRIYEDIA